MTDNRIMLKRSLYSLALLSLLFELAACDTSTLVQESIADLPPDHIILDPTGSSKEFLMSFSDSWTLTPSDSWIICSPTSGSEGLTTIKVTAFLNASGINRSGTLSFSTKGKNTSSIPVSQEYPFLRVDVTDASGQPVVMRDSVVFQWNQYPDNNFNGYSIQVSSNINWRFSLESTDELNPRNDFRLSSDSGSGPKTISFSPVEQNTDSIPHDALLKLQAYMPNLEETVPNMEPIELNVRQKNLRFLVNGSYKDVDVWIDDLGSFSETLSIDSERPWFIFGSGDWVNLESGYNLVDNLVVSAKSANPTTDLREHEITLETEDGAKRTVRVHQEPFLFDLTDSLSFFNHDMITRQIDLETSGPWRLDSASKPEWLEVTPTYGEGGRGNVTTIRVSCPSQNMNLQDRSADLLFKSDVSEVEKRSKVNQEKYHLELQEIDGLRSIPTFRTDPYDVYVNCDGKWNISSDASWVSVSPSSGDGPGYVKIAAKSANPDTNSDRSSKVTLRSVTHEEKGYGNTSCSETITQQRFVFELGASHESVPAVFSDKFVLDVNCSDRWEIVSKPDWLEGNTRGESHQKVEFEVRPYNDMSKDRDGVIRVRSLTNRVEKTLNVRQEKLVFNVDGSKPIDAVPCDVEKQTIHLNCTPDARWRIQETPYWVSIDKLEGTGSTDFIVSILDNMDLNNRRSGNIVIQCIDTDTRQTIGVSQDHFKFSVQEESLDFSEIGGERKDIHVDCSSNWRVVNNSNWIRTVNTDQTGSSMSISAVDNYTVNNRSGEIWVEVIKDHSIRKKITITQDGYKFNQDPFTRNFNPYLSAPQVFTVNVVCSGAWSVRLPSGDEGKGISVSRTNGTGNGDITVTVSSNPLTQRRAATISITADNTSLRKDITIIQEGFTCTLTPNSFVSDLPKSGSTVTCSVVCPSSWTISTNQSWISIDRTQGSGNGTVNIKVAKNSKKQRSGTVTLTSEFGHTDTITLTQKK